MVSRGHREQEVLDGYSVAKVLNYSRAARLNRRRKVLDQAVAVSLGIRDALNPAGKLIPVWLAAGEESEAATNPARRLKPETLSWFQQQPKTRSSVKGKD